MTDSKNKNRIIWAVDPFETEAKPDHWATTELHRFASHTEASILPVYLLTVRESEVSEHHVDEADWIRTYIPRAELAAAQYVRDLGIEDAEKPRVLINRSGSARRAGELFIEFASRIHSKVIVVSSRGKSGLGRMIFGSFSETLVLHSPLPILFLSHSGNGQPGDADRPLNRVLFSTDFSDSSKKAFEDFIVQFKKLDTHVILFHNLTLPLESTAGLGLNGGLAWISEDFVTDQKAWAEQEGGRWVEQAKALGLQAELIVKEGAPNIAQSILSAAHASQVGLVAMASKSGSVSATMLGSVAREVFRANQYPVWVYGPSVGGV